MNEVSAKDRATALGCSFCHRHDVHIGWCPHYVPPVPPTINCVAMIVHSLLQMTVEQRAEIMQGLMHSDQFCAHCGSLRTKLDPRCFCENDE